jgi:drug/metabolite transporter (DMT)-like permease
VSGSALAIPVALAAALAFSGATVMQYRVARQAPDASSLGAKEVGSFVAATVSHRVWLLSTVADGVGVLLHATALKLGALVVVQALLVSSVLFALVLDRLTDRRPPRRTEVLSSAALICGLGVFLAAIGLPDNSSTPPDVQGMVLTGIASAVGVAVCLGVSRRRRSLAAPALGVAAGISFAITAALIKACADVWQAHGIVTLLGHWTLWTLAAVGVAGLVLNQLAFQAGPLHTSLPAITVVDPLVSVAVGIGVFDETVRSGSLALAGQILGLVLLMASAIFLTTRDPLSGTHAAKPTAVGEPVEAMAAGRPPV